MANIWDSSISMNIDLAKRLIESQQRINIKEISFLGEGIDNVAYLINDEFVFRFPRREAALNCMENEIAILPYISAYLDFPFTCPTYIGQPTSEYPYVYSGYKKLPGRSLSQVKSELIDDPQFAKTLAIWLKQLHNIKINSEHITAIKGDQSWRLDAINRIDRCHQILDKYENYFIAAGFNIIHLNQITYSLSNLKFTNLGKSYLHGDLYARHILVGDNHQPSGLIDWGDVHIGDPGIDLSIGILIFTKKACEKFFNSYESINSQAKEIAIFRAFCHSMTLLPYGYDKNDSELKIWGKLSLENAITYLSHR